MGTIVATARTVKKKTKGHVVSCSSGTRAGTLPASSLLPPRQH